MTRKLVKEKPLFREGDITIGFSNNSYESSGNADRFPAGGKGKFTVRENKIIFEDKGFLTAEDSLILTKQKRMELPTGTV